MELIFGLQAAPRRCAGDGSMVAGAILGTQHCLSSRIAFPKRLKANSHVKILIQMKIFMRSGAVWRPKMAAKEASRAKEDLHLDRYFTSRSGFEAFRERYCKG